MGKVRQFVTELSAHNMIMAGYYRFTFKFTSGKNETMHIFETSEYNKHFGE